MVGAILGDLAAWTWLNDRDLFFPNLVSERAERSEFSDVVLATAKILMQSPTISAEEFVCLSKECVANSFARREYALMRSIVIGWLYDTVEDVREAVGRYGECGDKEDLYAANFIAMLIHALRHGATKSEAAQVEFCGTFRSFTKDKAWQCSEGPLGYLVRAWMSFYDAFDYGSTLHNALKQPGDVWLNAILASALADAMYGCSVYLIKKKYGDSHNIVRPQFVDNELYKLNRSKRLFFPKNCACTNVERHEWLAAKSAYADKVVDKELRRRMLKAYFPSWDFRFGIYYDDGWFYVYRSFILICRFQLKALTDGTYRIDKFQVADQYPGKFAKNIEGWDMVMHEVLSVLEQGWAMVSDE